MALPRGTWLLAALIACQPDRTGSVPPPTAGHPVPVALRLVGPAELSATASTSLPLILEVVGTGGAPLAGQVVSFSAVGGGWVPTPRRATNGAGRTEVRWFLGPNPSAGQHFIARAGAIELLLTAEIRRPTPGGRYRGDADYTEWLAGDLPIVVAAPHGGTLLPAGIPDRTSGTTVRDADTIELTMAVSDAFAAATGMRPHVIICHLSRRKLDANREIVEAAAGAAEAEQAWREYHAAIEAALIESEARAGRAFFIDLHGHGHEAQRLELGYLLSPTRLGLTDAQLAADAGRTSSSIWPLSAASGEAFPEVLRGPGSLGALLAARGYPSVPSPQYPDPGGLPYFDGGYSTARHAVNGGGWTAGLQIETHYAGVRDSPLSRAAFGQALVDALAAYLPRFGWPVTPGTPWRSTAP